MRNINSVLGASGGIGTGDPSDGLPGTGRSGPRGIESVLEYNGLYMNVRDWVDTFLVTTIGGLDDADIRDSREVNPGFHGEVAFKGYYGGRTITLSGKIYAKTLFKLRDMQQAMRQAFSDISQEYPLIFRTPDPTLDMMIMCKKSQGIQMADEQRTANHFERPFLITLRASNPRLLSVLSEHRSIAFTSSKTFFTSIVPTIEGFTSAAVLASYNERGGGYTVTNDQLVDANKPSYRNKIAEPDFDAIPAMLTAVNGTLSTAPSGGAGDDGKHGVISSFGGDCAFRWKFGVTAGQPYSGLCSFRSPGLARTARLSVEWLDSADIPMGSAYYAEDVATKNWDELRFENMIAPGIVGQTDNLIATVRGVKTYEHDRLNSISDVTKTISAASDTTDISNRKASVVLIDKTATINGPNLILTNDHATDTMAGAVYDSGNGFINIAFNNIAPGASTTITLPNSAVDMFVVVYFTNTNAGSFRARVSAASNLVGPPTPVAASAVWKMQFIGTQPGELFHADKVLVTPNSAVPPEGWFDGDTHLAKWSGAESVMPAYSILTTQSSYTYPLVTTKILTPATIPTDVPGEIRHVLGYLNDNNYIYAAIQNGPANPAQMVIAEIKDGKKAILAGGIDVTTAVNRTCFFRTWIKGGMLYAEWEPNGKDPDIASDWNPPTTLSYKLNDAQDTTYEAKLPVQLIVLDEGGNYTIDEWRFGSIDNTPEWTPLIGPGTVTVNNNKLAPLNRASKLLIRNDLTYDVEDAVLTVKLRYDDPIITGDTMKVAIAGKVIDKDNFVYAQVTRAAPAASTTTLTLERQDSNGDVVMSSIAITAADFPEDTDCWLRFVMNGDDFSSQFWKTDPDLAGGSPDYVAGPVTLNSPAADKFGAGVKGDVGIFWDAPRPLTQTIDDFKVSLGSFDDTIFSADNDGNFRAQPVIQLIGPMTDPILLNETNDERISIVGDIPDGESWTLDIPKRRMYRTDDNANRFQYLDVNSDWMELEPGSNAISVSASSLLNESQIIFRFNHTVM